MPSDNRPRFNAGSDWDITEGPVRSNQLKDFHSPTFNADPKTIESDGPGYVSPLEGAVIIEAPEHKEIQQPTFKPTEERREPWVQSFGYAATRREQELKTNNE